MKGVALGLSAAAMTLFALAGCNKPARSTYHPEWVIHSKLVFLTPDLTGTRPPLPLPQFRMMFSYIAGDLYGAPSTGDFIQPTIEPDYRVTLDLNASLPALLVSLEPTDFSLPYLRIEPAQARVARLAPMALQADGIDQIGQTDWVDPAHQQRLMLLYVDRAARISGQSDSSDKPLRFDMRMSGAGYFWVARQTSPDGDVYRVVAKPSEIVLAITPPSN